MKKENMRDTLRCKSLRKTCLKMKFVLMFMLASVLQLSAGVYGQVGKVTLQMENATFEEVMRALEGMTGYTFVYQDSEVAGVKNLDLSYTDTEIREVLNACLAGTGLTYQLVDNVIVIRSRSRMVTAADTLKGHNLKGTVTDEKKNPLPGVTIQVKGTTIGFVTDVNGKFDIDLPQRDSLELIFSFVGYKSQTEAVKPDMKTLDVVLKEDVIDINEVVVTGIFNKSRESFTGAVTTVTRDDIKKNYSRNLIQTLSNLDPSFRIIENNVQGSNPNALPELQLRGASTFASVEDLQNANRATLNTPLFILDGFEVTLERVMDLNDNEVESITVLKDASATAIYGSRGANGVVVITTVRPEAGKLQISYDGSVKIQIPDLKSYDYLASAQEKFDFENANNIWENNPDDYEAIKAAVEKGVNYDWLSVPVHTGVGQQHRLNFMGGSEEWRFRFDLSYDGEVGVMKGSYRDNYNGTLEVNYLSDRWTIVQSFGIGLNKSADSPYGSFSEYANMNRYWEPYDENGKPVEYYYHPSASSEINNPIYDYEKGCWNETTYTYLRSGTSLRYSFREGFDLVGSIGLSRQISQVDNFQPPSHRNFAGEEEVDQKGRYSRSETKRDSWTVGLTANWTKTFKEKHMLTLNLNGEMQEDLTDQVSWAATGFINDDIDHIGTSLGYPDTWGTNGDQTTSRRISLRGSANYYYDMRYFLDLSYSTDGSSSFGSDSRWGSFWSIGGGWNMANEHFIADNMPQINVLRLRYSYGVNGNMGFSPQDAMETFTNANNETYLDIYALMRTTVANPNLKWQTTVQHNVGIDFNLFNNRLQLQANYFNKLTKNTVNEIYIPISHGKEMIKGNTGKIRNEGWDFNVTGYVIRNTANDMIWSITGRFYQNKNTVVEISEAFAEALEENYGGMVASQDYFRYREGESLDAIYGLRTAGVDPLSGHRLYYTKDGGVTAFQRQEDMVCLGNLQPKVNGSIYTSFSYKGLSVNVGFAVKWGGKQVNYTQLNKAENLSMAQNIDSRVIGKIWTKPGDNALYKKYGQDYTYPTDMFVQKDNVFNCTNVNIMYRIPERLSYKLFRMEELTISAYLTDIFYLSTIKRERGTAYPFSVNPNFTISCTF